MGDLVENLEALFGDGSQRIMWPVPDGEWDPQYAAMMRTTIARLEEALASEHGPTRLASLSADLAELSEGTALLGAERVTAVLRHLCEAPSHYEAPATYWRLLRELKGLERALQPEAGG